MYCTFNGKICLMMWDIVSENGAIYPKKYGIDYRKKQDHVIPKNVYD